MDYKSTSSEKQPLLKVSIYKDTAGWNSGCINNALAHQKYTKTWQSLINHRHIWTAICLQVSNVCCDRWSRPFKTYIKSAMVNVVPFLHKSVRSEVCDGLSLPVEGSLGSPASWKPLIRHLPQLVRGKVTKGCRWVTRMTRTPARQDDQKSRGPPASLWPRFPLKSNFTLWTKPAVRLAQTHLRTISQSFLKSHSSRIYI